MNSKVVEIQGLRLVAILSQLTEVGRYWMQISKPATAGRKREDLLHIGSIVNPTSLDSLLHDNFILQIGINANEGQLNFSITYIFVFVSREPVDYTRNK